jgi:hypothetical protein
MTKKDMAWLAAKAKAEAKAAAVAYDIAAARASMAPLAAWADSVNAAARR